MADKRRTTDPPRTRRLIALVPLLWAAGCGSPGSQQRVVTVWAMGREGEVVGDLLPQFARAHPDIVVRVQQLPWYAAHEKLLTAFAGDATPDVCLLGNTWIPEFVALKALERLDEPLAHSGVVRREDYFPGIWDTNVVGGALYGVPWYVDTRLLFYRRDLLARAGFPEPPKTWQEWSRALAAIKALVGPERYSVLLPLNEFEPLMVLALQQGDPLLRDGGRYGNFESPGFRRAFAYYLEMFRRQWAPPVANTQISNAWEELGRGYYSFYINGPWNIGEFRRRLPPEQQGSWMTAPMPGPEGPGASVASGASLVIFRRSRHKRSEEHTSELQSPDHLVCRLLLEKKNKNNDKILSDVVWVVRKFIPDVIVTLFSQEDHFMHGYQISSSIHSHERFSLVVHATLFPN